MQAGIRIQTHVQDSRGFDWGENRWDLILATYEPLREFRNQLMRALEERVGLLEVLRGALDSERLFLRIGSQTGLPEMQGLSLVAANYGLVTRNLGTVSLIGPTRMDYTFAIRSVRGAAAALSEFVEDVYDG